jgi:hypothetical protein
MPPTTASNEVQWNVLIETMEFAENRFNQWVATGKIAKGQGDPLVEFIRTRTDQYRQLAAAKADVPSVAGLIAPRTDETPSLRAFRFWTFIDHMLRALRSKGQLSLSQSHALEAEAKERLSAVRRRLSQDGVAVEAATADAAEPTHAPQSVTSDPAWSELANRRRQIEVAVGSGAAAKADELEIFKSIGNDPAKQPTAAPTPPAKPRRNILEIVLDPRSIQWLLGLGGALMVVGLVILLWVNEFFTPPVMAITMGVINVAVLAAGLCTIRFTRYQMGGKALALLSCLVMPLNLWYYHTHDLVTIDGHLWIAAVIISAMYAASAIVLKDELFVYVFSAGVALTGLLILADRPPSPEKFWEIASPATLLVVLGMLAIHVERAFAVLEGPFSRQRFGLAFFRSGHVLLAAGLLLVFGAQLAGDWMFDIWFKQIYDTWQKTPSPICGELRWLAFVLVLAGTYAYIYSDVVVRRHGVYVHIAAFTLLWSELLGVQMLHLEIGIDAIIAVLAVTSLVVNIVQATVTRDKELTRSFPVFGLLLGLLPVVLGTMVYFRHLGLHAVWADPQDPARWGYVGAMLLAAVASRVGAHVYRHSAKWLPMSYFFATGAATMVAAVAALAALGFESWQEHAPILMLIPIAYLVAAKLYRDRSPTEPLVWVAHAATIVMLISSLTSACAGFSKIVEGEKLNLALAAFFAEAAVFYALATWLRKQPLCVHLAALMASGAAWQVLTYFGVAAETYILVFAIVGLVLLIGYRLSLWEQTAAAPLAEAAFQSANSMLSLSFISSVFLGLSRLSADSVNWGTKVGGVQWGFVGFCVSMLAISLVAVAITQQPGWRRWYIVTAVGEGALTLLALHKLIDLNPWQQVELFSVIVGLLLLIVGHLGWYREQDRESDLVSMSLLFGALLASVPLAIATWIDRGHDKFHIVNEVGFLFVSVLLLATGMMLQLKTTTLVGSTMTALYFVTLLLFIPWSQLNTVATAITIGGGAIFGTGLLLAFYRDRLLSIPDRIKHREGLFKVLNWR